MPRTTRGLSIAQQIGARIREERTAKGLSQERLGHESGLHPTYVSRVERGEQNPTALLLVRIADALDINPARLIDGLTLKAPSRRRS